MTARGETEMTINALFMTADGFARIATADGVIETCRLHEGRYVRVDDAMHYPQLCHSARRIGSTIVYHGAEDLARACGARLYKTEAGFKRAAERLAAAAL